MGILFKVWFKFCFQELVNEKIKCQRLQDDLEAAKKEVESVEREKKQSNRASYCG